MWSLLLGFTVASYIYVDYVYIYIYSYTYIHTHTHTVLIQGVSHSTNHRKDVGVCDAVGDGLLDLFP